MENTERKSVEWLWLCKLKTRYGFLLITEFIPPTSGQKMPVLGNMLPCLNKFGKEFFLKYVYEQN